MVQFNGAAERPANDRLPSIALNLEPAESRPGWQARADASIPSGTFTTMGVPPGKYFIRVVGAPQGWTFHSAMVNGRDASVVPIDIEANDVGGVMIAFTDKPSEFAGDVSADTGSPEVGHRARVSRRPDSVGRIRLELAPLREHARRQGRKVPHHEPAGRRVLRRRDSGPARD